jgi:hypothetical protein
MWPNFSRLVAIYVITFKPAHYHSIDDDIIDVHGRTIGAIGYAVYGYLSRRMNRKTGQCNPSISRIAQAFDMTRSTVKVYLYKLRDAGLLKIEPRKDPAGDSSSNNYILLDPSPAAVKKRLAEMATERAAGGPDGGRSPADPPPLEGVGCLPTHPRPPADPGGRSPADPKPDPDPDPLTTEMNQPEGAVATEETQKTRTTNPCPHPLEERISPGDIIICLHCMAILDRQTDLTLESLERAEEGQAHATCAA